MNARIHGALKDHIPLSDCCLFPFIYSPRTLGKPPQDANQFTLCNHGPLEMYSIFVLLTLVNVITAIPRPQAEPRPYDPCNSNGLSCNADDQSMCCDALTLTFCNPHQVWQQLQCTPYNQCGGGLLSEGCRDTPWHCDTAAHKCATYTFWYIIFRIFALY